MIELWVKSITLEDYKMEKYIYNEQNGLWYQQELTDRIYRGKYTPSPVRRVEIPKADGGVRKFGIPTVVDRTRKTDKQRLCPFVRDCEKKSVNKILL